LVLQSSVFGAGVFHGSREAFEDGFEFVVIGAAVFDERMEVGAGVVDETSEEIFG
jgi:hypothetical protein